MAAPLTVRVEPAGWLAEAKGPAEAVELARDLLERARAFGHPVPRASFYVDGVLVRAEVTRTDLAVGLGRCWCGRGALYGFPRPGEAFCCAAHEVVWRKMVAPEQARVIAAQFVAIYARGGKR